MIDNERYKGILEEGLILDHYLLLCQLKEGIKPLNNRRVQGFINLLTKKEYIKEDVITDKGLLLVEKYSEEDFVAQTKVKAKRTSLFEKKITSSSVEFEKWSEDLYKKCQLKLKDLVGKPQVTARIDKKAYPFICNIVDFQRNLKRAITNYKLTDYDKIETCVLRHIEKCHQASHWFPLMKYYFIKDGNSELATDLMSIDDSPASENKAERVDPNSLF